MDDHTLKKKKYLSKLFAINAGLPGMYVPLVEIVKTYPMNVLDELFSKIERTDSDLYYIYKTMCNQNNAEFVRYIIH